MADIGVLVKVSAETHVQLKKACGKHQRSIQKVMLALLEGWLANGAPDPLEYGSPGGGEPVQHTFADQAARESILKLASDIEGLKSKLKALELGKGADASSKNWDAFFAAVTEAASQEVLQPSGSQLITR